MAPAVRAFRAFLLATALPVRAEGTGEPRGRLPAGNAREARRKLTAGATAVAVREEDFDGALETWREGDAEALARLPPSDDVKSLLRWLRLGETDGVERLLSSNVSSNDTTTTPTSLTTTMTTTATATATTTTTTPSPSQTLPPATGPRVDLYFVVSGIDYNQLQQNSTIKSGVEDAIASGVAQTVNDLTGPGISIAAKNVRVTTFSGSVDVHAVIYGVAAPAIPIIETELARGGPELSANVVSRIGQVPGVSSMSSGTVSMGHISVVTAGVPASACTWKFLGYGYCYVPPGAVSTHARLGGWVRNTLEAAKAACCANQLCDGFHMDTAPPTEYVLLDRVAAPQLPPQDGTRMQCWERLTPSNLDLSAACRLRALALAPLLAVLAALTS